MTPALVMAALGQAVLHSSRDMVKPVLPGSSSALLPWQEEESWGSVGKSGSAAQRIPAVIPPAPLAAGGARVLPERDWGASWALCSPQDWERGPAAASPPLQIAAVSQVQPRLCCCSESISRG